VTNCAVCEKEISDDKGLVSSTGVEVCGEGCRTRFMSEQKPHLTVYSRVTGYCTPVSSWNKGKLKEFQDRVRYSLES
jgi:anaerobic ribonucleoside-triphosphate reductase